MLREQKILIGVAVLLVVGLGAMLLRGSAPVVPSSGSAAGDSVSTTTEPAKADASDSVQTIPVKAEYTVIPKTDWSAAIAPDYRAPLVFSEQYSSDVQAQLKDGLASLQAKLAADAKDIKSWSSLGVIYKIAGDYQFAAQVWEYLAKVAPTSETPFYNLGDLYENSLHDYPKAETNYLIAIQNAPKDLSAYQSLHVMYANKYKQDTSAAEDILKKGIAANPRAYNLQVSLGDYYKTKGRNAEAKAQYEAAAASARSQGYTDAAVQIEADIKAL